MNTQNVASLEASKRLVEVGIIIETEFWHKYHAINGHYLVTKEEHDSYLNDIMAGKKSMFDFLWVPAPPMPKKLPDVIECCAKCPYYNKSIHCCTHKDTLISEILDPFGVLPVWCPLEDVK